MTKLEKKWDFICDEFKKSYQLDINHLWLISKQSKEIFVLDAIYTKSFMGHVLKERTK